MGENGAGALMKDRASMTGIESVHIGGNTTVESLEKELFRNDTA